MALSTKCIEIKMAIGLVNSPWLEFTNKKL